MKLSIQVASTSQTINVFIQDSSSLTGEGLAGLAYNSDSLTAYYALPKAAAAVITLVTLAAITTAWSSGGFKEIDATNMPGWYRLDIPDAALASGRFVSIQLKGATNMAPLPIEIELTGWNNQDAVHGGMTALPNVAAGASGGLPLAVDASGRVDVLKVNGTSQTARDLGATLGVAGAGLTALGDTRIGNLDAAVSGVAAAVWAVSVRTLSSFGTLVADAATAVWAAATRTLSAFAFTVTAGTVSDKTGYSLATAPPTAAAIRTEMDSNSTKLANLDATTSSRSTYAGGAVASVTAPVTAGTVSDKSGYSLTTPAPTAIQNADALLTRDWTAVTGEAARSVLNALRFLRNKWTVVAGTLTVTKEDDTAAAWTGTVTTDAAAVPIVGSDPT